MDHPRLEDQLQRQPGPYATALRSQAREIRLFTLFPGAWDSPICGQLSTAYLCNSPAYDALSYAWGDSSDTTLISLSGRKHAVTRNLETALRHLREIHGQQVYWIDAISINQCDNTEKSEQVSMMGEVFSCAQVVKIWVGESTAGSDMLMTALDSDELERVSRATYDHWEHEFAVFETRAWFTRLWVLQEIVLAQTGALLFCGLKFTSWSRFVTAWTALKEMHAHRLGLNGPGGGLGPVSNLDHFRKLYARGDLDFDDLIYSTGYLWTSDARDHVYALRGLLCEEEQRLVHVDYTKAAWEVFAEAMQLTCQRGGGFSLAPWVVFHGGATSIDGLPTWVPDLANSDIRKPSTWARLARLATPADTMRGPGGGQPHLSDGKVSSDLRLLSLKCLLVGTVTKSSAFDDTPGVYLRQLRDAEAAISAAMGEEPDPNATVPDMRGYASREPLWRVFCSNRDLDDQDSPAPDSYESLFQICTSLDCRRSVQDQLHERCRPVGTSFSVTEVELFCHLLRAYVPGRTLFTTANGLYGMGHPDVQVGDVVCIAFGTRYVLILRPPSLCDGTHYRLVGAAYVAGIMDGETVRDYYEKGLMEAQTVTVE